MLLAHLAKHARQVVGASFAFQQYSSTPDKNTDDKLFMPTTVCGDCGLVLCAVFVGTRYLELPAIDG